MFKRFLISKLNKTVNLFLKFAVNKDDVLAKIEKPQSLFLEFNNFKLYVHLQPTGIHFSKDHLSDIEDATGLQLKMSFFEAIKSLPTISTFLDTHSDKVTFKGNIKQTEKALTLLTELNFQVEEVIAQEIGDIPATFLCQKIRLFKKLLASILEEIKKKIITQVKRIEEYSAKKSDFNELQEEITQLHESIHSLKTKAGYKHV